MRILTFDLFEAANQGGGLPLTDSQKKFLDRNIKGSWTWNPETGKVDVDGKFSIWNKGLKSLQGISFGTISSDFDCSGNQLASLEGAPEEVGGDFDCSGNLLTSLKGAPKEVGGNFSCSGNELTSLEDSPQEVGGNFVCYYLTLASLKGVPQKIGGCFLSDTFRLKNWSIDGFLDLLAGKGHIADPDATRRLILPLLDEITAESLLKGISNREDRNEILSIIRREEPELWTKIQGSGSRSSLSADMGDLFF